MDASFYQECMMLWSNLTLLTGTYLSSSFFSKSHRHSSGPANPVTGMRIWVLVVQLFYLLIMMISGNYGIDPVGIFLVSMSIEYSQLALMDNILKMWFSCGMTLDRNKYKYCFMNRGRRWKRCHRKCSPHLKVNAPYQLLANSNSLTAPFLPLDLFCKYSIEI